MVTHRQILARFSRPADVARACGVGPAAVNQWRIRDSIPGWAWLALIQHAAAQGVAITLAELAEGAARRKGLGQVHEGDTDSDGAGRHGEAA